MDSRKKFYMAAIKELDLTVVDWVQRRHHRITLRTPEGRQFTATASVSTSDIHAMHNWRRDLVKTVAHMKENRK